MKSGVSAEELAKIAGVKATTVRKIAHDLLEPLGRDPESHDVSELTSRWGSLVLTHARTAERKRTIGQD